MTKYKLPLTGLLCLLLLNTTFGQQKAPKEEIIYHIFQRSFYDSDGDQHGDLNGIRQKLDYLQQLGVTAIQLVTLYESVFYHNYFATDFYKIDPRYGTMHDYLRLVKELHRRHMKFYMDMETQYVAQDNIWYSSSHHNPQSPYADYIEYTDKTNNTPLPIVGSVVKLQGYDDVTRELVMVNLDNKQVQDWNYKFFKFWVDPNGDGKFDDGVDGFRLDHMMDNLDNKNVLPHLFDTFWGPLLKKLRKINPNLTIVAEQADWASLGTAYLTQGHVDRVFDFRLAFAIRDMRKKAIAAAADSSCRRTPPGKQQVVFIENHDMPRFASVVKSDPGKLRAGAALNLLIGGIPAIYYGQELGMTGASAELGPTDANQIPDRQAFEWYKSDTGKGMALWYKLTGPWKDTFNDDKPNDGISLEEERNDPNSLWNFYRSLILLRKNNPVLIAGGYKTLLNNNDKVYSFLRYSGSKKVLVVINLSADEQQAAIPISGITKIKNLFGNVKPVIGHGGINTGVPAYATSVWELK